MDKPLRFHPTVADDIREGERWYGQISDELRESFRELVDKRFDDIEDHPQHFGNAFDNVRFANIDRFPYIVLFEEGDDDVFVLGVFFGGSDPDKWRERLVDR